MLKFTNHILILSLVIILSGVGFSQSRQEMEKQRLNIIKDIEKTSKALESTQKQKKANLTQLKTLENQMESRKKLISNLKSEVLINEQTLVQNLSRIAELKIKHGDLKDQYANILRASYLNKMTNSKWTYLLSSENLNKLLLRWRYMNQFDNYTKQKIEEINSITKEIHKKNDEITITTEKTIS